ncbi:MAG TPA: hypothetical protein VEY96_12645, partial [Actinomycetes bacterium]|nr:hypothetical protein [Actinomycetes bacterium]
MIVAVNMVSMLCGLVDASGMARSPCLSRGWSAVCCGRLALAQDCAQPGGEPVGVFDEAGVA